MALPIAEISSSLETSRLLTPMGCSACAPLQCAGGDWHAGAAEPAGFHLAIGWIVGVTLMGVMVATDILK